MSEPTRITKRFKSPSLKVIIDGVPYNTLDWSLGGISVSNYTGDLTRGKTTKILLGETSYSKLMQLSCIVVRKAKREDHGIVLALRFDDIPDDVKMDLHDFLRNMAAKAPVSGRRSTPV